MSSPIKPTEFHKWSELPDEIQLKVVTNVKKLVDVINAGATNKKLRGMMNDNSRIPNWIKYGVKPPVSFSGMQKLVISKVQSFDSNVQSTVLNQDEPVDIFSEAFRNMNQAMISARQSAAEGDVYSMDDFLERAAKFAKKAGLEMPRLSTENMSLKMKNAYVETMTRLGHSLDA